MPSPGTGKVLLDETPIGNFLEIEGSPRWIDGAARRSASDRATTLHAATAISTWRTAAERRILPSDMLFQRKK